VSVAPDPAFLLGRALTLPCVLQLQTLPPYQDGFGVATHPVVPCEPRASSIKKSLAGLPMQLLSCAPNARTHVSNVPDVEPSWAYKTCRQAASLMHARCADRWL
jgi:hypothetical protein